MTATDHLRRIELAGPGAAVGVAGRRTLTLRWEISPLAVRGAPVPAIAAMNGQAEKIARAALVWRIADRVAAATLVLEIGEDDVTIPLSSATGRWVDDEAGGFEHADFGDALRVSMRDGRVVWARTGLLEGLLGLRGGVYEGPVLR